jgi:hypothetical protein
MLNTRGCGPIMHSWYRRGFVVNLIISSIGILLAAYEFFLYSINKRQYNLFMNDLINESRVKFNKIYKNMEKKNQDLTQVLLPYKEKQLNGSQYTSRSHIYENGSMDEKLNLTNYKYDKDKPTQITKSIIPIKNRFKQFKMSESQELYDFDENEQEE